jgi:hypothetical protein
MAKKQLTLEANMMRITVGYQSFLLPWADGMVVVASLERAQQVKSEYRDSANQWSYVADSAGFQFETFTPMQQANLMMNGSAS